MMRRAIAVVMLAGVLTGCVSVNSGPETGGQRANFGQSFGPPMVPGVKGPHGEGIPMMAPYNSAPPGSEYAARVMMSQNQPLNMVQMHRPGMPIGGGMGPTPVMPPGGWISPPGVGPFPGAPGGSPMPPGAGPFQKTGMMGRDSGVIQASVPPGAKMPGGVVPAQFASGSASGAMFPAQRTQVFFTRPAGMKVHWFTQGPDGKPNYSLTPLETPGRYNFAQGAIYRLKLTHIPGRPALELYPTLEVVPTSPKTNEFLAHNTVPLDFTEEDFKQVIDRNYIVKVVYLPDPNFQEGAGAGPDEIVSTRLDAGQDPIQEAMRRGSILLVLRIGNIDQGLQHSPSTTAPIPGGTPLPKSKPSEPGSMKFDRQIPFPVTPILPGDMPKELPPPLLNVPKSPDAKTDAKPEVKKEATKVDGPKVGLPGLNLPAPPGLVNPDEKTVKAPGITDAPPFPPALTPKNDKPFVPPMPNPLEKIDKGAGSSKSTPTVPPVTAIPTSLSKEKKTIEPETPLFAVPTLPGIDRPSPSITEFPTIPLPPPVKR